ncbi:MAG TPA: hypothetical protein EYP10_02915, partial [Armatimonadetes bacterium]|nr:hypothetical protein [Armatimonadota bacterium]
MLRIQLATLVFGLYLFIIGGTVAALFTPLTQLLNHLICMGMVIGIVIYIMSGRTCTSYEGRGHLNAKCDQTLQRLPAWMHVKMPPVLFGALLLALLRVVITTVTSIYPRLSWEVAIQRIWYAVTFIIAYLLLTHLRHLRAIVYAMLSVAGYEQMQSVAQWLTWLPRRPPGEPFVRVVQGTLNHPNDLAMFLVLVLPLWFALLCESGGEGSRKWMIIRRVIAGIGLLTCMFCLMLATSRSGYMGLFALAFAFIAGAMRASLSQSLSKWLRYNWVIVTALAIASIIG